MLQNCEQAAESWQQQQQLLPPGMNNIAAATGAFDPFQAVFIAEVRTNANYLAQQ